MAITLENGLFLNYKSLQFTTYHLLFTAHQVSSSYNGNFSV